MTQLDHKIIGKSPAAERLKKMIELVAVSNAPAIVLGPTGSGKELVAAAIHELSRRKGNFIAINCAAIPAELMEAEIFGFEKGAFTGAQKTNLVNLNLQTRGRFFSMKLVICPSPCKLSCYACWRTLPLPAWAEIRRLNSM